ncbi:MAG: hypothetical protein HC771_25365 [Synechococcales cyanobacterium CRU_2_2]|nr:hypothetical protein [Synechococcales cyanobacterium CRU_2_2]
MGTASRLDAKPGSDLGFGARSGWTQAGLPSQEWRRGGRAAIALTMEAQDFSLGGIGELGTHGGMGLTAPDERTSGRLPWGPSQTLPPKQLTFKR